MSAQVSVEVIDAPPVSVEVIEDAGVLVVEIDRPAAVDVIEVVHPGPQGQQPERRHDWTQPHDYLGTAPLNTADGSPAWRITRLTINSAGAVTATGVATDVTWTGRAGHTYS